MFSRVLNFYNSICHQLERQGDQWFIGLFARFTFAAVLFGYYLNSAMLKVEDGFTGFFTPSFSAYIQILTEQTLSNYDFDAANLPFTHHVIVYLGTYMEFLLPILIVLGLFTRLSALAMVGFVVVQSFVDIAYHGAEAQTIGALFDIDPASTILDQRLLWIFLLSVLIIKGGGLFSIDHMLNRMRSS